jgi:hypothetical protein
VRCRFLGTVGPNGTIVLEKLMNECSDYFETVNQNRDNKKLEKNENSKVIINESSSSDEFDELDFENDEEYIIPKSINRMLILGQNL